MPHIEVQHQQKQQAPPLPTNKVPCLVRRSSDGEYGNAGVISETDNYGHAHNGTTQP